MHFKFHGSLVCMQSVETDRGCASSSKNKPSGKGCACAVMLKTYNRDKHTLRKEEAEQKVDLRRGDEGV